MTITLQNEKGHYILSQETRRGLAILAFQEGSLLNASEKTKGLGRDKSCTFREERYLVGAVARAHYILTHIVNKNGKTRGEELKLKVMDQSCKSAAK